MKDIKQIIANNLISLRKQNGMTQNDLAEMLNYSDNTISRWEHAEITPSIETLQQIADIYNIPLEYLIKENVVKHAEADAKSVKLKKLVAILMCVSIVWFVAVVVFFYFQSFTHISPWTVFVWAVPVSCLILLFFNNYVNSRAYSFTFSTICIWTTLASVYLQFLKYNLFLLFTIGIPAQIALTILTFVRPKNRPVNKEKS